MSHSLLAALAVMALSQLFKLTFYSLRERKFALHYLFSTGGMPSAHSAFVTTLTVSVGLWRGVATELFAVTTVFSCIIVYDSARLRGAVDLHTRALRLLFERMEAAEISGGAGVAVAGGGSEAPALPRRVGHTPVEVLVGIVVGAAFALVVYLLS